MEEHSIELSKEEKLKTNYQLMKSLQDDVSTTEGKEWLDKAIHSYELVMAVESEELLEFLLQQKEAKVQRFREWSES